MFVCATCGRVFVSKASREQHNQAKHPGMFSGRKNQRGGGLFDVLTADSLEDPVCLFDFFVCILSVLNIVIAFDGDCRLTVPVIGSLVPCFGAARASVHSNAQGVAMFGCLLMRTKPTSKAARNASRSTSPNISG